MLDRIIPFAHKIVKETITKESIVIDATCGNGNDTEFLAMNAKHVYAFDIQEIAITRTKERLKNKQLSNVSCICDTHEKISSYVSNRVDAVMYNLGYLPNYKSDIITSSRSTINSIIDVLDLLHSGGIISITVYTGHEGGIEESNNITTFVRSLPKSDYDVLLYRFINKEHAPYNIFIQKK